MLSKVHRDLGLHIVWLLLLTVASVALLSDAAPRIAPFLNDRAFFAALVEVQLAFVLLAWPIFLSRSAAESEGGREALGRASMQAAGLVLLSLPVMLVAQAMSDVDPAELAAGWALLIGACMLVGTLYAFARAFAFDLPPYYYLGLFATQALLPYAGYLVGARTGENSLAPLKILSPFWAAATLSRDSIALAQAAGLGALAVVFGLAAARGRPIPSSPIK